MRPRCGFRATRPQHAAGLRVEPAPQLAWATGNRAAAAAPAARGLLDRALAVDVDEGAELRIERLDAPHAGLDELAGADVAAAHETGELAGRTEHEIRVEHERGGP